MPADSSSFAQYRFKKSLLSAQFCYRQKNRLDKTKGIMREMGNKEINNYVSN